ncbi:MAG: FMN-binding protein [Alphaproteobacteria bacterium]|nr:FMN-binding protein [Alphaproteobacteria bacterium]
MRFELDPRLLLAAPVALLSVVPAHARVYFTLEQAQQAMLPGQRLAPVPLRLTAAQQDAVEQRAGSRLRDGWPQVWRAVDTGSTFLVDQTLGKHEYITYALVIDRAGAVRGLEVMEYRESYGDEIRDPGWRRNFLGKTAASPVKLEADIPNISGATLSSKHVTEGVRRLLALYDVALR